jgi:hypothetical protein
MKRGIIMIIICALYFCAQRAQATLITIQIEGVVDSVSDDYGYLEGKIKPGDIITGFYTYESTTPDSSPLDPIVGHYYHHSPPTGISLTISGFEFKTDPSNVLFEMLIVNNNISGHDIYALASFNNLALSNGTSVEDISWQLNDLTGTVFSSDALPTTAPVLDDWQTNILNISGSRTFGIWGHVTSAVPEPVTLLLLGLGGLFLIKQR